jgi:ribose/xylose/arabinose/galactoside ABC-type transport system permease subunit
MGTDSAVSINDTPRASAVSLLGKNWALLFLLVSVAVFSFTGSNFLSLANLQNILYAATIYLLLASAETFVIITGGIDLSVGYVKGLSSVVGAVVMRNLWYAQYGIQWPPATAAAVGIVVALAASLACGLASGVLVSRFRVPPFIATLGVLGVAYGVTLHASDGGFPIGFIPPVLREIGNGYIYYHNPVIKASSFFAPPTGTLDSQIKELVRVFPYALIVTILFLLVLWYVLKHTRFGHHTYAIGGSMDAAVRAGINTKRHLLMIYMLSAFLAGVAGVVDVFQTGTGNFTPMGANFELFAIAAVIIGGASLMGGKGRILASAVGVLLLQVLDNGLNLSGVESFYRYIATGVILIVAVVIDQLFPDLF